MSNRSGIPEGLEFLQIFFNRPSRTLVALFRKCDLQAPRGRVFTRALHHSKYELIGDFPDAVSVQSLAMPATKAMCFVNTLVFNGPRGDWLALYALDLNTLKLVEVVTKKTIGLPPPYDDAAVLDLIAVREDGRAIDCSIFLRNQQAGNFGYFLCTLETDCRRCEILEPLLHGRF